MATYVIGDIHGAYRALTQLIERVKPSAEDTLIFLGDYVDGWSESAEVVNYLMQLEKQYNCLFIKGNHDAWCELWLNGTEPDPAWRRNGGDQTVKSYAALTEQQLEVHREFYGRLRYYYVDNENRLFIHAGFASMHGPEKEHYVTNYYWDRTLWELVLAVDKRIQKDSNLYPKRLLLYKEIFIGHTPTLHYDVLEPMHACNVWNLDTGAAYYGRLTAMNVDTAQFWQSDEVQLLYPGEKGRNR